MIKTVVKSLAFLSGITIVNSHATTLRQKCVNEIRKVEKDKGIDPGLLEAIAQIESKMNPYVVNACGQAFHFSSARDAAQFVKKKQAEGYRNISVGPMQLHVPSHSHKFKSIEQMCEIESNVAYSAKLLKKLKKKTGSNEGAVKLYHSPNSYANEPYKARVFGAWAKIKVKHKQSVTPIKGAKVCPVPKSK